ncbi:MAG: TetR/AcrR family transcriptional regulator [Deltaproteobacteria bacterium]|nr:TetR/AcrR family transcriptional regulator [Deltaproteobacteria bacterium]
MSAAETTKTPHIVRHPSQDRILDVCEQLFADRGFSGVGLAEVAERAGLSKSSLFHHFKSKTEIYASVLERLFKRLHEALEAEINVAAGPWAQLDRVVDIWVGFMADNPNTAKLLLRSMVERDFEDEGLTREELARRHGLYMRLIIQRVIVLMKTGIEQGAFRQQPVGHFVQTLIGATIFHFASGEFGKDMLGGDIFEPRRVEARKTEMKNFLRHGLGYGPGAKDS